MNPYGIRPLVIGKLRIHIFLLQKRTLDIVKLSYKEVENGEIVIIENNEMKSVKPTN